MVAIDLSEGQKWIENYGEDNKKHSTMIMKKGNIHWLIKHCVRRLKSWIFLLKQFLKKRSLQSCNCYCSYRYIGASSLTFHSILIMALFTRRVTCEIHFSCFFFCYVVQFFSCNSVAPIDKVWRRLIWLRPIDFISWKPF